MIEKLLVAGVVVGALLYYLSESDDNTDDTQTQDETDNIMTGIDQVKAAITGPGPIADMHTSQAMCDMLMAREAYAAKPYNLGDGGWTWGYGHQGTKSETPPAFISKDDATALFLQDVVNRGEYWVKLYVTVPLTQNQFDALVSIAFNMSSRSFKKFADSVNAGSGIDAIAQQSVSWVDPKYQKGIQNRRNGEMNVFNNGVYA